MELRFYVQAMRDFAVILEELRKLMFSSCIPNHHYGTVGLFDASVLLDEWCDDLDHNHRKYVNAFRINIMVNIMCMAYFEAVQLGTSNSYYWMHGFLILLSRAMINLAICYKNMNMYQDVPWTLLDKAYELIDYSGLQLVMDRRPSLCRDC